MSNFQTTQPTITPSVMPTANPFEIVVVYGCPPADQTYPRQGTVTIWPNNEARFAAIEKELQRLKRAESNDKRFLQTIKVVRRLVANGKKAALKQAVTMLDKLILRIMASE